MAMSQFIGRKEPIFRLKRLLSKKTASLVVIKGRRRVGKSRLVEEFGSKYQYYCFSGLSPTKQTTAQTQRNEFALLLSQQFDFPEIVADDWSKLFKILFDKLSDKTSAGRIVVLFDEITWMADKDPLFLGKLKNAWDLYFQKNPQLILVLCGSVSAWIEKNIISSKGFFGRISEKITLSELSLSSCNKILENVGFKYSPLEKFMLLSITGGIPWYLEQIDSSLNAMENIKRLCFISDGLLVNEFKYIFGDLFGKRSEICTRIVNYLANGAADFNELTQGIQYAISGSLSEYIDELITSGFVARDYTWQLKTGRGSKLSKFRLRDNYLRFYLKYMLPKLNRIRTGGYVNVDLSSVPGFYSMLGLQFENLVLNNRSKILEHLNINSNDIVYDNPFFQRKTDRQQGCQIDYLIQTKFNVLYVVEIKFSRFEIKSSVIDEVKEKINRISLPRHFSCIPVLVHVNGLSDHILGENYFGATVDFSELLLSGSE